METMGRLRVAPSVLPRPGASPNGKTPPSAGAEPAQDIGSLGQADALAVTGLVTVDGHHPRSPELFQPTMVRGCRLVTKGSVLPLTRVWPSAGTTG